MDWKDHVFKWTPETLDSFRQALGEGSRFRTNDELCSILNVVIKTQQIDLLVDIANKQIEELLAINDNKWEVIDALLEGDGHKALDLMNMMSGQLKKTLSSELLKSHAVTEKSNVVQFRRQK